MLFSYLLLVILLNIRAISSFPFPDQHHISVCFNRDVLVEAIEDAIASNEIVIAFVTYSVEMDGYLSLYLGTILRLFDSELSENSTVGVIDKFHAIIYQSQSEDTVNEAAIELLQILPLRSIFVSGDHGVSSFGIKKLMILKHVGIFPSVYYHINHEKPWQLSDNRSLDFIYSSVDELVDSYMQLPLVLRNYYYSPLKTSSYYIPVGAPYYGYILGTHVYYADISDAVLVFTRFSSRS